LPGLHSRAAQLPGTAAPTAIGRSRGSRAEVRKVARDLLSRLKTLLVLNSRQKSTARSQLKLAIKDLLDTDLPRAYDKSLFTQKCLALFEHIYESYAECDAGVYAEAG